ncbi:Kelch repeat type 1 [Arabidopsis thaliana x Arabidopsis arenosa]|uniref:Kelch repeat type 1 n=1 Tax=Arabidopsis thaliana x Arabidopsis arenosa TaxID=1240361 RepID=A0A8T2FKG5_9BRAS|nr:Kelch repeat type 1 [Arabidopsis thaliana x Arabidopsis arenosa]
MSSSPEKKRRKKLSPESNSLPNDLIVTILARLSRSYYPKLSLVSKTFRAILASPELYQTRILLSRTETFLYVCLSFPGEPNPGWFTLYRKPNQTLTTKKKKNSVHLLAPILNSPPVEFPSLIAVGSYLYAFRAAIEEGSPFSNLWFLDCRTHTWLEAPRMRLALTNSDLDGYMYLAGTSDSLNCVEVYNTDTQTWIPVPPNKRIFKLQHMKGMLYMNVSKLLSFAAQDAEELAPLFPKLRSLLSTEVVAFKPKVSEGYEVVKFRWRRRQGGVWRSLVGLEGLPKFARYSSVKLADCGGKLVVLWHKYVPASGYEEKMVWCAEISLEKRSKKEIWGKIEWFDAVLRVPKYYQFVGAKSATV